MKSNYPFQFSLQCLVFLMLITSCKNQNSKEANLPDLYFQSDNEQLNKGFVWAKEQAMKFVFKNDPVGKWYEASLPGRSAFCMRDVSHQAIGAQVLGLGDHNKNMLKKFAQNISESKDWCSYWEINKDNLPAPVDYKNDAEFWYNLPANFDVLYACYRLFQWTGDSTYILDSVFLNFYNKTVNEYVTAWDKNGDGLMENKRQFWPRGIPTYWESENVQFITGSDLVASMYAGYFAYSRIADYAGDSINANFLKGKANQIETIFNIDFWDRENNVFFTGKNEDGTYDLSNNCLLRFYPLYHELISDRQKIELTLRSIGKPENVEEKSYLPEVYFMYNQNEMGLKYLIEQVDPSLDRRDYPEVSFTAIGNFTIGLMGISPHAAQNLVSTLSHLSNGVSWAEMKNVPVLNNNLHLHHTANKESRITNISGNDILWQACFPVLSNVLLLDGISTPCERTTQNNTTVSYLLVRVKAGETHTVQVPF